MSVFQYAERQFGLARWRAERAGQIQAPPQLRAQVARSGWSPEAIDAAFEVLAALELQKVGGKLVISGRLDSRRTSALVAENLAQFGLPGWFLTAKGEALSALLSAYGAL